MSRKYAGTDFEKRMMWVFSRCLNGDSHSADVTSRSFQIRGEFKLPVQRLSRRALYWLLIAQYVCQWESFQQEEHRRRSCEWLSGIIAAPHADDGYTTHVEHSAAHFIAVTL